MKFLKNNLFNRNFSTTNSDSFKMCCVQKELAKLYFNDDPRHAIRKMTEWFLLKVRYWQVLTQFQTKAYF